MPVIYRDDWLLAVDKPSGLASHRGWAGDEDTAADRARALAGAAVHLVHRLDRGTSGVLLFALSSDVAAALGATIESGGFERHYVAAVRGEPPERGTIDHAVRRGEAGDSPRLPAVTLFRRLASLVAPRYSVVTAQPVTGRLHQIRRHLKHLGHPILGDVNYGRGEHNRLCRAQFGLHRIALHASVLAFTHPVTGAPILLRAPLPDDLRVPLLAMGFGVTLTDACDSIQPSLHS